VQCEFLGEVGEGCKRDSRDEVVYIIVFGGGPLSLVDERRGSGEGVVGFADEV
jgi:hypothetical protein